MFSYPGSTLEDFLAWNFNIIVEGKNENNKRLDTATEKCTVLTKEDFDPIVRLFENFRKYVEQRLDEFDDDNQSWRNYADGAFNNLPDHNVLIFGYLKSLANNWSVNYQLVFSKQEMIKFLFKSGTDFTNPVFTNATLPDSWCWKTQVDSDDFIAIREDGEAVTKQDVEHYVEMMNVSYNLLHPEINKSNKD